MSEEQTGTGNTQQAENIETQGLSELDVLKQRARFMNIPFSNNIRVETLRQKIQDRLDGKDDAREPEAPAQPNALELGAATSDRSASDDPVATKPAVDNRPFEIREREKQEREQMRLIRCRITNLDPKKKELPGEVYCVANEYVGTVRKFIPFGEATENGYHLPFILYENLRERKFLSITTKRDPRTKIESASERWVPEFAIEVLEPLTREELDQLAQAQIAAGSLDN
jgi:hypothetical protein